MKITKVRQDAHSAMECWWVLIFKRLTNDLIGKEFI